MKEIVRERSSGSNRNLRSTIEKERTKMRERQRRSITTNIFHGLRQHGGYRLSPRADINEVLRHLAQEAGWVVEPDGTTYRSTTTASSGSPACTSCGGGRKSAIPKARTIAGDSALNSLLSAGVPSLLSTNNDRLMAVYMSGAGPENACVSDAVCSAAYGKEQQFYLLNEANGPHENMLAGSPSRCT